MKLHTIILLTFIPWHYVTAQKTIHIVDDETLKPLDKVIVGDSLDMIAESDAHGMVKIPYREGRIIFADSRHDRLEMDYQELPDTLRLIRTSQRLDEVVVVGKTSKKFLIDPHAFTWRYDKTTEELKAAKPSGGIDILGLISLIAGKKKNKDKKSKVRKILDDY